MKSSPRNNVLTKTSKHLLIAGVLGITLLVGVALFAGGTAGKHEDETWDWLQQTGTLRVGMDASYPPFETLDGAGNVVGLDVDLAHEIGKQLDLDITIANITYDGLADALISNQVDILISALVSPPQLEGKARLSIPYFNAGDVLVVPNGSPLQTMADMEGHTLAVEYGSSGDVEARKWERRLSNLEILRYPLADAALGAVLNGETDAALTDGIAARLAVEQHDELAFGEYITEALFVVVLPKDSPTLEREVNSILAEMLRDGTIEELIQKWFGP